MPGYIRDGRAPVPKDPGTSVLMSRIRARDTGPELRLRKALSLAGVRGYRLHPKGIPGRPDVAFIARKIAIFVHGCFWHRCPTCSPGLPRSHSRFWQEKFRRNSERDQRKVKELDQAGWKVLVCWECALKEDIVPIVEHIKRLVK